MSSPMLEVRNLSKRFGGLLANHGAKYARQALGLVVATADARRSAADDVTIVAVSVSIATHLGAHAAKAAAKITMNPIA